MARVRILSSTQALFVGPAPSSGGHFLTSVGALTNVDFFTVIDDEVVLSVGVTNAIKQINGVIDLSYGIESNRTDIKELGRKSNVNRSHLDHPEISLDFSYYGLDVRNEIRLGFNVNFPTGIDRSPFYDNNLGVPLISGFTSRSTSAAYPGYSAWPYSDRDRRNFFVSIAQEGTDALDNPAFLTSHVIGFGDCHIKSYSVLFQVDQAVRHDLSYSAENIVFYLSGSGQIPAANPINLQPVNSNQFLIPKFKDQVIGKDIMKGSDTSLRIVATGYGDSPEDSKDLGFNLAELKIQSAKIELNFERQDLKGLGYKNSVDRFVKNPTLANLSIEAIVGEDQEGRLRNLLINDHDYNLSLQLSTPPTCGDRVQETVVSYDFLRARFNSIQYTNALNEGKLVSMTFTTELTDDVTGRGFYISGRVFRTGETFSGFNF